MKKLYTIAAIVMALMVFGAGTGLAWNLTPNNRVYVSADDRGDLLYNQLYLALDGGWVTDLWVANMRLNTVTQQGRSIIAKLTVHSGVFSADVRDINIYLTPGDVCRVRLYYDTASGAVRLFSTDGSVRNNTNTAWASAADPLDFALGAVICNDTTQYGYVTIVEVANSAAVVGTTNLAAISPSGANSPERVRNTYLADAGAGVTWNYGASPLWDGNWLTGYTEIRNTAVGLTSGATTMLALADYRNLNFMFESEVVRVGTNNRARNNLIEVEAVLSTIRTDMPFVNNATDGVSLITHTFPTKYAQAWLNPTTCLLVAGGAPSEFFNENVTNGRIPHMRYAVDMNENLRMSGFSPNLVFPDEVNGVFTDAAHDPVLFSTTMNMGYMITEFNQLANFITQGCRRGYGTDTGDAFCPNDNGTAWYRLLVDATNLGNLAPAYWNGVGVVPAGYALATPVTWEQNRLANGLNSGLYTSVAWPGWVDPDNLGLNNAAQDMTQYFYGVAFTGAPVIAAELRFGGQSFSFNACSRTLGMIGTTTSTPGTKGGTIGGVINTQKGHTGG